MCKIVEYGRILGDYRANFKLKTTEFEALALESWDAMLREREMFDEVFLSLWVCVCVRVRES